MLLAAGPEVAGCGILGNPGASAASLVGGVRVPKTPGLLPTHWQVEPGPGVSARLLAVRAVPGVWLQGPGIPELVLDHCGKWGKRRCRCGQFLIRWGMGSGVSRSLHCPASGQGLGPAGSRVASGLHCRIVLIVFLLLVSASWWFRD